MTAQVPVGEPHLGTIAIWASDMKMSRTQSFTTAKANTIGMTMMMNIDMIMTLRMMIM